MPTSHTIILIAATIGIVPVFWWLLVIAKKDGLVPGNIGFFAKVFFWGMVVAIPVSLAEVYILENQNRSQSLEIMRSILFHKQTLFASAALLPALIIAAVGEFFKGISTAISLLRGKIETPNKGIISGAVVGLAFAIVENGVYFAVVMQTVSGLDLWGVFLLRFLLSTFAHIFFSSLMGAFLARAKMSQRLTGKVGYTMIGFLIAVIIHATFNFFLGPEYIWIIATVIACGFVLLSVKYSLDNKKLGLRVL